MILDGGPCAVGIESTIIAFTSAEPMLLRPGGIGIDALAKVLGAPPRAPDVTAPRASGTLESHYAPRTPARIVAAETLARESMGGAPPVAVLARTVARPASFTGAWIDAPDNPLAYAHDLYANLRALDHAGANAILIEGVPDDSAWLAVRDRLARATN